MAAASARASSDMDRVDQADARSSGQSCTSAAAVCSGVGST